MTISKEVFEYAWNWFEYHAAQRLLAFRYFLIFLGIIVVAINNAIEASNDDFTQVVSVLGCFISVAFLALEVRNEELVNVGREALRVIEDDSTFPNVAQLKLLSIDSERNCMLSHKFWLRMIYVVSLIGFGYLGVYPRALS